jgi:site-specific recombinase XerD
VRTGLVSANPVSRVPRYKENPSRVRFLSDDEELALRKSIQKNYPERETEIDVALNTGARRGEQFLLTWDKVDLQNAILELNGKTGPRTIEINSVCRRALMKLYETSNGSRFVCPETKREGQRDWRRWFKECVEDAKIDNFTWHDLRHTFASRLVMAGVDIRTVQELLGHKNITQTMKYAHLSRSHTRRAIEKLESSFPLQSVLFQAQPAAMDTRMDKQGKHRRKVS